MRKAAFSAALLGAFAAAPSAWAVMVQPVPIPEDAGLAPQLEIDGVGIGTLGGGNPPGSPGGSVDFSDSSLLFGAAQRLFEAGGIGSMGFGLLAPDSATPGTGSPILIHQAFLDYQIERAEWLVGRTDNPASHLVDFPTLRDEDLITFTHPLDPYADGQTLEDNRYSNSVSLVLNQGLSYFESLHAQHLVDRRGAGASEAGINSFGFELEYLADPGAEALSRVVSYGLGFERQDSGLPKGINQLYAGGVLNLHESVTDRVDFRVLDLLNLGTDITQFQSLTDTFQASYNSVAASVRYLHTPFGRPGYQLSLTGAYRSFANVSQAQSWGVAATAVRRLGAGFDLAIQYLGQWRDTALAAQYQGPQWENVAEVGMIFNFNATFNSHISPRRTLLNFQHQYIPD